MPESVSTENIHVAMVFAAVELTKLVGGVGAKASANNVAGNYKVIHKAVVEAYNSKY